jgi:hypothetical protein
MQSHCGITLTGKKHRTQRKTCPSAILSTKNPNWNDLAMNSGLCSESLATNHLSHGMALVDKFKGLEIYTSRNYGLKWSTKLLASLVISIQRKITIKSFFQE